MVYLRSIEDCKETHHYWVMNKDDFKSIKNIDTVSFKIYQNDRGHYNPDKLLPFKYDEVKACELQNKIKNATNELELLELKEQLKKHDPFLKLDEDL